MNGNGEQRTAHVVLWVAAVCSWGSAWRDGPRALAAEAFPRQIDTDAARLELLPPGTVIGNVAPDGWSHLILKSLPRAAQGDLDRVDTSSLEIAALFSTTMLARVEQQQLPDGTSRYGLRGLAGGVCTAVRGKDTIVSPDSWRRLGADLNLITAQVLKEIYRQQSKVQVVARSETLAVVDTPIMVRKADRNVAMALRYAIVVDPARGDLETLAWLVETDRWGRYTDLASALHWLPQNNVADCPLHLDISEYSWGIPSRKAFACVNIPRGRAQQEIPLRLQPIARQARFAAEDAWQLDNWLRAALTRWNGAGRQVPGAQGGGE